MRHFVGIDLRRKLRPDDTTVCKFRHLLEAHGLGRQYPRYSYRPIEIFLARQGFEMSAERTYRLWRQAKLDVPRRQPRRRIATGGPRPTDAAHLDQLRLSDKPVPLWQWILAGALTAWALAAPITLRPAYRL